MSEKEISYLKDSKLVEINHKLSNNKIDLKLSIFLLLIISSTFIHINQF